MKTTIVGGILLLATACGDGKASEPTPVPTIRVIEPTNPLDLRRPTPTPEATATPGTETSAILIVRPTATPWPLSEIASHPTLPKPSNLSSPTSGDVPLGQSGVDIVLEVNEELFRLASSLPDVENRPALASLPGARGLWISEDVRLRRPGAIAGGREFTRIHPDGSMYLPLPLDRAMEAGAAGWGEQHPGAREGSVYGGMMLIYAPHTMEDMKTVVRLIVESYNFVTARNIEPLDVISGHLAAQRVATQMPMPLPQRESPRPQVGMAISHFHQQGVDPVPEIYDELFRLAFSLPRVEERPSNISPGGAAGLWISEGASLKRPEAMSEGGEFAHIHPDASVHLPLPADRIMEVRSAGWGERHPAAGQTIVGVHYSPWLTLIYTPTTTEELDVVVGLIVESYNFVTGRAIDPLDVISGKLSIPLPRRESPQPHVRGIFNHQEGVEPVPEIYHELFRLAFSLPEVEERPSNISPRGAAGLWISEGASLKRPEAMSEGGEFAHIHPDASVHLPLPADRIMEVRSAGWGERHPAAGQTIVGVHYSPFLTLLYTPMTTEELDVVVGLIVESYNFVTGSSIDPLDVLKGALD